MLQYLKFTINLKFSLITVITINPRRLITNLKITKIMAASLTSIPHTIKEKESTQKIKINIKSNIRIHNPATSKTTTFTNLIFHSNKR